MTDRAPAISKRAHPAESLPERPTAPTTDAAKTPPAPAVDVVEKLTMQHNVRIRPSTRKRLEQGHLKLQFESGDRTISIASITDAAINEYLDRRGC